MKKLKTFNFSLVELMVVVVIIGLLAGVVGIAAIGKIQKAKVATAKANLEAFDSEITSYKMDTGRYPTDLKGLVEKPEGVKGWGGPYLKERGIPEDPWYNSYVYQLNSGDKDVPYKVFSMGEDGQEGTEDDVYISDLAAEAAGAVTTGDSDDSGLGAITPE
ncbi:MAG: type II secretion system protein GspG [Planctomycetota bacterium]|nr:MAG: type II secretion system protein GspG [Planctomycetota bacterium]